MSDMKGISSQEIAKSLRQCTMAGGGSNACAECALHGRDFEQDCFDELNCMAASAIEGLQAQLRAVEDQRNALLEENRWIPVEERMPDAGTALLAWESLSGAAYPGTYDDKGWFLAGYFCAVHSVTHWKPMPKGPEVAG